MQFDLGPAGLGLLVVMSLTFGAIAQVILWRSATHWLWLIGSVAYFIGGLVASEVIFATATVEDLQPLIDGLFFDEALLGGLLIGVPTVIVAWIATRQHRLHPPASI